MELIPGLPNDVALQCLIWIPFDQFSKAASVCKKWNAVIKQPEFCRLRKDSGLTQPLIALAQAMVGLSGLSPPVYRLTLFEPVKGCWYDLPPIPEMVAGLPLFSRVIWIGSDLAVIGGCDPESWRVLVSVFIYSFVSATWRRGADMPGQQRLFFGCAVSEEDGTVVVAGGHDGDKSALMSTLAYDVASDTWTPLPDMSSGRDECTCVFHRGKFQVIGGYDENTPGEYKQTVETLDLITRRWSPNDKVKDVTNMSLTGSYVEIGGTLYTCRDGDVVALGGATWAVIARVPHEIANVAHVTGWQGKLMVIGNAKYGEAEYKGYVLELKSKIWKKVEIPSEYCGHVQSGCCVEL